MGTVHIGVAGWDYPDWNGTVYPAAGGRSLDRLAYISRFVDVIEINTTFYNPVSPSISMSWVRRTSHIPGIRFTAKAHRSCTHEIGADLDTAVTATLTGLEPLRNAGLLAAVLVQFPQSFRPGPEAEARLEGIASRTSGWPVVVEVRNRLWDDERCFTLLNRLGLGWCVVDQPQVGGSTIPARERVTSPVAYLRLHGRNTSQWFNAAAGRDERYDYLYDDDELKPLAYMATRMAEEAEEVVVIHNNHRRGQALANTLQLARLIGREEIPAPEALTETYPELEKFCMVKRERLF